MAAVQPYGFAVTDNEFGFYWPAGAFCSGRLILCAGNKKMRFSQINKDEKDREAKKYFKKILKNEIWLLHYAQKYVK